MKPSNHEAIYQLRTAIQRSYHTSGKELLMISVLGPVAMKQWTLSTKLALLQ